MPLINEDLQKFSTRFPKNFWSVINRQYFDELEPETTETVLEGVHNALRSETYSPSKPRYYMDKDKGLGVLRRIPVLEPKDYAVYFYALSMIEEKIAANRIDNTYGGWSLGGLLHNSEDKQLRPLLGKLIAIEANDASAMPTFSYNEYAWAAYYGDYQKKLYATLKNCIKKPEHLKYVAVQFDIANFYDNVRLNILEKNLRSTCSKNDMPVVDLLCHFLKYWNRDVNGYDAQLSGIPQDAFADCSRIIANFYLQDYDFSISEYCDNQEAVYFRYADDQIIIAKDFTSAQDALHKASLELSKLGLNINKSKVYYRSIDDLIEHFSFTDFRKLHENKNDSVVMSSVAENYLSSTSLDKKYSLLNKLLGQNINLLRHDMRTRLIADAFNEDFITTHCRAWTLEKIYKHLDTIERRSFIEYLEILAQENEFTSFHFELLTFFRKIKHDTGSLIARIHYLHDKWS